MSLTPGVSATATLTVSTADLATTLSQGPGDGFPPVLATARMIGLMELAASRVMHPILAPGEVSVGVDISTGHTGATPLGVLVTAEAVFRGMEGKLYTFDISARDSGGEIGRGTHKRAVVLTERLLQGASRRNATPAGDRRPPTGQLASITPFFIVNDLAASIRHYIERFGFGLDFQGPGDDVYYAQVKRDNVAIMLKTIVPEVQPSPNHTRHPWARWDAYVYTPDPDSLFEEFKRRGASFVKELSFIDDGLWGFEVTDGDGYVLAFFRLEQKQNETALR